MKDYKKYINALRECAKEHENDRLFTSGIIVSDFSQLTLMGNMEVLTEMTFKKLQVDTFRR